ncbi:maltose O-acetyltransferase [Weissella oryzae SG25]|uniref:Maltose O-acetyltransferase n=1 Tax=Weissella oryzae (strain DSM 25784 / JCM 18191 / LMG 30913 / SG25) TaxID=1329250 RepID=A0A069CUG6_WEIOS|nr:sugar O-acetyltransferase [Weissella oryzae]GAK30853.1 maltose O-acetyltransferase [Weissella oryzae SG25]
MAVRDRQQRNVKREKVQEINNGIYSGASLKAAESELFNLEVRQNVYIEPPFYIDYGSNVHFGEKFYANTGCIFIDTGDIFFGNNVTLGPRVQIYTATHPVNAKERIETGLVIAEQVTIGENVWIGGGVIINPGVTIGDNTVIGSGSVVTKSIPANVLAAGNPAVVKKHI